MIRRRWHRVSVGVRAGRKASVVEQECWRLLRETIHRVEAGRPVDGGMDRLLSAQLAAWLKEQRLRLKPRSYENHVRMAGYIEPRLGDLMLGELTRERVADFLAEMARPRVVRGKDGKVRTGRASRHPGSTCCTRS
jgi:hypothetical protein